MIDLTPILQALIGILAALITVKVIPWIKSKTTAQQQATLSVLADIGVHAAEQVYGPGKGKEKLEYAANWLLTKGYAVDIEQIEAAVKKMNDKPVIEYTVGEPVEDEQHT